LGPANCIFCAIIDRKIPAKIIYEDEKVTAFWDARPVSPVHVLIVPRNHIATLNDIPMNDPILSDMGHAARVVAQKLGVADPGYRFSINVNRGGGQVVFHLHAHLTAGRDLGTFLITGAIVLATTWRRLVSTLRGTR
jgi:histidine triad (HIT) family protein